MQWLAEMGNSIPSRRFPMRECHVDCQVFQPHVALAHVQRANTPTAESAIAKGASLFRGGRPGRMTDHCRQVPAHPRPPNP